MLELLKNIGLGFFVNGNYALLNGNTTSINVYIVLGSVAIMAVCIFKQRKDKQWIMSI